MRILVVDSESDLRALVGFALRRCGFIVQELASTSDALAAIQADHPDAVAIAVHTADQPALALCQAIRSISDAPLVLFNAPPQEEHEIAALNLGADAYLYAPLDIPMLCARVRALVRRTLPRA